MDWLKRTATDKDTIARPGTLLSQKAKGQVGLRRLLKAPANITEQSKGELH